MAAEVGGDSGSKKKGKKGRKKRSNPRIDMTPMVDLGFLLLTFFVLTTTMSTPSMMPVLVPADKPKDQKPEEVKKLSEKKVLNLIITGQDRIYWYQGIENVKLNQITYTKEANRWDYGIRKVLKDRREDPELRREFPDEFKEGDNPLIVLIKMTDDATYKNMVDILDEMNIGNQKKYMLLEAKPDEILLVKDYDEKLGQPVSVTKSLERFSTTGTTPKG